ncbi:LLM class flavin-dependent oxidoreductase [Ferrovibrio sp.]|uniref:LLM class flavin-dependent oxidoreductase n=1 Tax=Ferrovibrio sp. TaxID=1917215 RepID=UPI0035B22BDF
MLKPIIQIYPMLPTKDENEREALRPIGRNREIYQQTLKDWHDIVRSADDLGIWGAATIEHHFWSEGYEVGPSPGIMNAYWAAITKNIRVGQLGYVMSTQNPIRVAEDTAIIDHLSGGRCFVGFARGYQSRWTNVVGQHLGAKATKSPTAAVYNASAVGSGFATATDQAKDIDNDAKNRAIFEEGIEIVMKSWTKDSYSHKGMNWEIPYPFETGVDDWQLAQSGVTQRLGAPNEIGPDGNVREVCVAPAPFQRPHPPVFVSGSGSPQTIEYTARNGFIPVYFTNIQTAGPLGQRYLELARGHGHDFRPGQNQALVRWVQIGKTEEAARKQVLDYDYDIFKNFYSAMGRRKLVGDDVLASLMQSGLYTVGTIDSVRKQLMEEWSILPAEYFVLVYHFAQMPKDAVIENMELFMKHIKPDMDEMVYKAQRKAA